MPVRPTEGDLQKRGRRWVFAFDGHRYLAERRGTGEKKRKGRKAADLGIVPLVTNRLEKGEKGEPVHSSVY